MGSCTSKPHVDSGVRQYLGEAIAPAPHAAQPAQLLQVSTQLQDLAHLTSSLQATVAQLQQQQECLKDQLSKASVDLQTLSRSSGQHEGFLTPAEELLLPGGTVPACHTPRRLPPLVSSNGAADVGPAAGLACIAQAAAILQPLANLHASVDTPRPSNSPRTDSPANEGHVKLVAQLQAQLDSLSQRLIGLEGNMTGISSMRESWEAQRAADEFAKQLKKVQEMGIPMHSLGRGRDSQRGSGHGSGSASVAMSWDDMPPLDGLPQNRYPSNPHLNGRGGRGGNRGRRKDDLARGSVGSGMSRQGASAAHGGSSGGGAGANSGGGGHAWGEAGAGQGHARHPTHTAHSASKPQVMHHLRAHSSVQPVSQRQQMEFPADSCRIMSSPTLSPPGALGTARSVPHASEPTLAAGGATLENDNGASSTTSVPAVQSSIAPVSILALPRFSRPGTGASNTGPSSTLDFPLSAAGLPAGAGPTSAGSLRHRLSHSSSGSGCGAESTPISPKNLSAMGASSATLIKELGAGGKMGIMQSGDLPSSGIQAHWGGPASGPL